MGQKLRNFVIAATVLLVPATTLAQSAPERGPSPDVAAYLAAVGACACPYHAAHDGHLCGSRSAWSRRGGASPQCFKPPVTTTSSPPVTPPQTGEMQTAALPNSE